MTQKAVKFSKMHGLGNDFIVINAIDQAIAIDQIPIVQLAHRHLGIGFDQLLVVSSSLTADFSCRIFNSDGSEAEQCGNGMRCVARFIQEEKLSDKKHLSIELKKGHVAVDIIDFQHITVDMGMPELFPAVDIEFENTTLPLTVLSLGNPHAVLSVKDVTAFSLQSLGPHISTHHHFPHGVNVGFMQVLTHDHIRLRTYERGAGETLACGSNSCAAVVAGIKNNFLSSPVKVELPLGKLIIEWKGQGSSVKMTGPAEKIFDGFISL